ncbi:MAG TPA: glycosyltransferase family 9 protein [Ideonella sp.]|uniref:glycosyltransferase family 9 protein n=1 Tax=Ideonella sp. TaxID=1929293 RepID=UPI002BC82A85|nr:glycosyltransferase family 9 protein [Ideonella sp.]
MKRVLITNGAHLGDVVLSTAVLPVLKAAFPGVRIGMLVGNWSRPVVDEHPLLDWIHRVDHWKISRADLSRFERFRVYWRTRRQALREIREVGYDVAIDLYFYFPNSVGLLWQAGIPRRIGYTSAGLGPLLHHRLDLDLGRSDRSIVELHLDLVRLIPGCPPLQTALAKPVLPRRDLDTTHLTGGGDYIVLHMGSGSALKDWPEPSWQTLARRLVDEGCRVVLTGSGAGEKARIVRLKDQVPEAIDLCDRAKWGEFIEIVAGARLLVGVDSVAGHAAAAVGTPVVIARHGMNNLALWRPVGARSVLLMHVVPCAPCYRKQGCSTMDCLRQLAPDTVLAGVADLQTR